MQSTMKEIEKKSKKSKQSTMKEIEKKSEKSSQSTMKRTEKLKDRKMQNTMKETEKKSMKSKERREQKQRTYGLNKIDTLHSKMNSGKELSMCVSAVTELCGEIKFKSLKNIKLRSSLRKVKN